MTETVETAAVETRPGATGRGRVPDILDVIAALSSDAVPTPPLLARALLDLLPVEVWSNPDYRWLDPATKSGSILREVARRLMDGLAEWEPDPHARADHILRKMLFGAGVTRVHAEMTRRSVYESRDATSDLSAVRFATVEGNLPFVQAEHDFPTNKQGRVSGSCRICGAPPTLERGLDRENYAYAFIHGAYPKEEMADMRFDVIVGNPPYQIGLDDNTRAKPIYHHFIDRAIELDPKYLAMIVPSRWFTGGLGLDEFRERMIADRRLRVIVDNPKVFDCFPGVKIQGGVNYFLWDRDHDGDCEFSTRVDGNITSTAIRDLRDGEGVLIRDNKAVPIVAKVLARMSSSVEGLCSPTLPFGLRDNHPSSLKQADGDVPVIHGSFVGYVLKSSIAKNLDWVNRWKVLLPRAFGDTTQDDSGRPVFTVAGEPIALAPGSVCTLTYVVAGLFDSQDETENYAHYLATKFVRFLVLQRKTTQDITPDRFRFVPALDMTRRWTDPDLYTHFGLTQEEIDYIEATIKPRSVNLSLDSPIPASHLKGGEKYREPGSRATVEVSDDAEGDDE
ncbi:MAG: Eco57I restriction-modification methylase domain-containing protein [Actinobacteria bacterium]|nr:Eco57I restriction-modification methylase domain-containing protein [Actinomycetota bacterium]